MFRQIVPALLLLFTVPLHAKLIHIEPPAPTSDTPVRVIIAGSNSSGCNFSLDRVNRNGSEIALQYRWTVCLNTPRSWSDVVPLGVLQSGQYTISVTLNGTPVDSYELFVADAKPPLKVFPSSKPAGAIEPVQITSASALSVCEPADCVKPTVTFGGVVVPDRFVTVVDAHTLIVSTMPHDPGLVDVTVQTKTETITAPSVFRFRKRGDAPDPALFERILLPIAYNGFGAYRTWWRTDLNILNTNPVTFGSSDAARTFYFFPNCVFEACPGLIPSGGNASIFDVLTKSPSGLVLMPQRDFASGLQFSYRMWEMDQVAQGLSSGTELPVVRERDFRRGKLNLVQVPLDHRSRTALRIYGPDAEAMSARVRVFAVGDLKPPIAENDIVLQAPACTTDPCDAPTPSFAMIPDLEQFFPQIASLDRVRIEIEPALPFRFWAFATITNNTTQHVTVVTPQ